MRSTDLKYLGYGLGIGVLLASLFFAAIFFVPQFSVFGSGSVFVPQSTPTQAIMPILLPTSTSTLTIPTASSAGTIDSAAIPIASMISTTNATFTLTLTPSPTATLTQTEIMIANGEIAIVGPLTREEQIILYESSLFFLAPTYSQSRKMSGLVNQLRFSDPSTTCGPLSIAILQKAGILNEFLVPHDFFLINPDVEKDRAILESAFPAEYFSDTRYKVRIDQMDWLSNPLVPGDFVYIYAGTGGNFEHMLVVNRVDIQGRAYSVTNFNTEDRGFIIDETLLYDPSDRNAGLFSKWTEKQYAKLGSTGFAGYEVWRLKGSQ